MYFEYMAENLPPEQRTRINEEPRFSDDKLFLPLKSADMLAWHLRTEHEDCVPPETLAMADELRLIRNFIWWSRIEASHLAKWAKEFRRFPGVPLTQGKAQWKQANREIRELHATGFKPPHGDWEHIHRAKVDHLEKIKQKP